MYLLIAIVYQSPVFPGVLSVSVACVTGCTGTEFAPGGIDGVDGAEFPIK